MSASRARPRHGRRREKEEWLLTGSGRLMFSRRPVSLEGEPSSRHGEDVETAARVKISSPTADTGKFPRARPRQWRLAHFRFPADPLPQVRRCAQAVGTPGRFRGPHPDRSGPIPVGSGPRDRSRAEDFDSPRSRALWPRGVAGRT